MTSKSERDDASLRIGLIGTGLMGGPMAARLHHAGRDLRVWNRSPRKTRDLEKMGVAVADTIEALAAESDVVILIVSDGPAATDVLFGENGPRFRQGTIVVDMSSIAPDRARSHAERLGNAGIWYLDAPVSGGAKGAADGTLAILVGGDPDQIERVRPILNVLGRPTRIGSSGAGQIAKLANQVIVAVTIGAVAEALIFARANGADPAMVREALTGGFADSRILSLHGQRMIDGNWVPGGMLKTQVKDIRTMLEVAAAGDLELPLSQEVAALFESAMEAGLADHDHSAVYLEIARRNQGGLTGSDR